MSFEYEIFMDTAGDIDRVYAQENGVHFIGMNYTISGAEHFCGEMQSEEIMKKMYDAQRNGDFTRTSQITPQQYVEAFKPVLEEGKDIIYICLSSGLSKTFDSVHVAMQELEEDYPDTKIYPIDSLSATGGMGLLTEYAVRLRKEGKSAADNAAILAEMAENCCHVFMVNDLDYLKRGGRVSAATAAVGTILNVKPILIINSEGKLTTVSKKRGEKPALKALLESYKKAVDKSYGNRIYVCHGDASERANGLIEMIKAADPDIDACQMMLSPVIGAHTGPGMCAIIFFGNRNLIES